MTQQHTPGPWRWHMAGGYAMLVSGPLWDVDPWNPQMSGQIADDGSAGGEYRVILDPNSPNGKLIAAAPELLAALEGLLATEDSDSGDCQWCTEEVEGDQCNNPDCPGFKAFAAIAKAKGGVDG